MFLQEIDELMEKLEEEVLPDISELVMTTLYFLNLFFQVHVLCLMLERSSLLVK